MAIQIEKIGTRDRAGLLPPPASWVPARHLSPGGPLFFSYFFESLLTVAVYTVIVFSVEGHNAPTEDETMQSCQDKANERAYEDGQRCRNKGFGITKSGLYDYAAWDRLFTRGYRHFVRSLDRDEARQAWRDGWHDEDDRLSCLRAGALSCGRPI